MTVAGIIEQFNTERPNQVDDDLKLGWLKRCEQMIINEVIISHEHDLADEDKVSLTVHGSTLKITPAGSLESHMDSFGLDTELLVPEPYDEVYIYYLDQKIGITQADTKRYNMAVTQYNNSLLAYQQYFNRTYKTKKKPSQLFHHDTL